MSTEVLLNEFKEYSEHPYRVLSEYKKQGKKVIGMLPYYAPAELVVAAGMVPMGIWGSNKKTIALAKEYCATFYCTIAQLALEMLLDGTLDQLDGVITPTICDTLRPMSQNIRVAMSDKLPCIFLAHPQYRKPAFGLQFTVDQYMHVKSELEKIAGKEITAESVTRKQAEGNVLVPYRGAMAFEEMRLQVDRSGKEPKAFMLTCGNLGMARARSQFSCNFFACAGIKVIDNTYFKSIEEGAKAALESKAQIVVVCASDDDYAEAAPKVKELLGGKAILVVAGAPACAPELEAQGITNFINVKSNVLETLKFYLKEMGI